LLGVTSKFMSHAIANERTIQRPAVRAIAFHLPQFHPIPENDEWWGQGFTEWSNVVQAKPLFAGHYQPHLPADLGFYDLRVPEVRAAQAELAASHGIHGFCYYHYWFHGRRVLERPVNEIWKSGEPDFPWCLCWANENWTRQWDGHNSEILLEQRFSVEDDVAHIRSLIPMFEDPRYIRVEGKPLFLVYRATKLPEPKRTTETWRREAEKAGLGGLFLVRVESHAEGGDPQEMGYDCSVEFQPRFSDELLQLRIARCKWWHRRKLGSAQLAFYDHRIFEYEDMARCALAEPAAAYPRIPCVCPGWDNSPRRKVAGNIFVNSTPEKYERWLREVVNRRIKEIPGGEEGSVSPQSLIFINAWNEWAEGNHLEPCQRWGCAYLEATRRALGMSLPRNLKYADR
jgi:lipopolysaccharide biosynthesis protein